MNWDWCKESDNNLAIFDSRIFNIPKEEVCNYFIWRQQDWLRNSIQMLSQFYFSQKELNKKKASDMHEMLHKKGVNWADLDSVWKNGTFIFIDDGVLNLTNDIIFTKSRVLFEKYLEPKE
jgi:tRNA(His) 5'-end guanylyltransferase